MSAWPRWKFICRSDWKISCNLRILGKDAGKAVGGHLGLTWYLRAERPKLFHREYSYFFTVGVQYISADVKCTCFSFGRKAQTKVLQVLFIKQQKSAYALIHVKFKKNPRKVERKMPNSSLEFLLKSLIDFSVQLLKCSKIPKLNTLWERCWKSDLQWACLGWKLMGREERQ